MDFSALIQSLQNIYRTNICNYSPFPNIIISELLSKNYHMDRDTPAGTAEPTAVSFEGQMLFLSEPAPGTISIVIDEPLARLRHELKAYPLAKINYRTVLAALKKTHPQIISAALGRSEAGKFELTVTVAYEFLPQVKEAFRLESKVVEKDESERATVLNLRNYIRGMREELSSLGNMEVISGTLEGEGDAEIFCGLASKLTVFTLNISLTAVPSEMLKVQMFYYNSATKQRRNSGVIPQEGIYVYNNGKASTEIKFLAEFEDFEMVVFKIWGRCQGSYIITGEKVESL